MLINPLQYHIDLWKTFDPSAIEKYRNAQVEYSIQLFDRIVEIVGLTLNASILEVGTGPGNATKFLAAMGYKITGKIGKGA